MADFCFSFVLYLSSPLKMIDSFIHTLILSGFRTEHELMSEGLKFGSLEANFVVFSDLPLGFSIPQRP